LKDWENFATQPVEVTEKIINPLHENTSLHITKISKIKAFKSKAKPILFEFTYDDQTTSKVIIKKGDDLRKDWFTMTMFNVFNELWETSPLLTNKLKPHLHTYKVVPLENDFGLIECVDEISSVAEYDWEKLRGMSIKDKKMFIASAAGSFVASWVLGIRDRHKDNMLIKNTKFFFHIDFGHLFNEKPLVDAPRMPIPKEIENFLTPTEWREFKETTILGFKVLYENGSLIRILGSHLFQSMYRKDMLERFFGSKKSLMLGLSSDGACKHFEDHIYTGCSPFNVHKIVKNIGHQDRKSRKRKDPKLLVIEAHKHIDDLI